MNKLALMALATFGCAGEAAAQRADQNAARSAEDAFGVSYANESVGLYDEEDVRGFSPIDAGNVRIEGLYIDQQADLSYRIVDSSIIRVGLTAIDYPFPAPTGIADFRLPDAPGSKRVKPTVVLHSDDYPTLVRFRNPIEITSMEVVEWEDLPASFGPGTYLHRIMLQVTDDPVTEGRLAHLPNIGSKTRFLPWQLTLPQNDARSHLTMDDFLRNVR